MTPEKTIRFQLTVFLFTMIAMIAGAVLTIQHEKVKYPAPPEYNCGAVRC